MFKIELAKTIALSFAQLSELLFCGGESNRTDHHTGRKVLVDRAPRPELGVDRPEQDAGNVDRTLLPKKFKPPEQDAGEQGGRATDVDGEHQVDLACVLHLKR